MTYYHCNYCAKEFKSLYDCDDHQRMCSCKPKTNDKSNQEVAFEGIEKATGKTWPEIKAIMEVEV